MICLIMVLLGAAEGNPFSEARQNAARGATVKVVNATQRGVGTGVIIGRRGDFLYVLTARHVIRDAEAIEVVPLAAEDPGKAATSLRKVEVAAVGDDIRDLALLRISVTEETFPVVLLCPARSLPKEGGFKALSVGCSNGGSPTCEVEEVIGRIKATRGTEGKAGVFWEVARKVAEGRSGGPLIDERGRLIGICSGVNKTKGYFTHADEIRAFLEAKGFEWLR